MDDQLRDHRIVERRDGIAFAHAAVDAHVTFDRELHRLRHAQMLERAGRRQKPARRIFRVDARFDRVAFDLELLLSQRQRFARCNLELPFDQIEARDHLRHRMLDLQARVDLHEENWPSCVTMNSTVPAPT